METDASDYALAAILSMYNPNGELHPITFHSQTFSGAELNYNVHDKELLAIYEAFWHWRHYFEGPASLVNVITDYKNLEYFTMMKLLTRRQARWSEYFSQFNMIIRFRPGKLGTKPDALTRLWDVYLKEGGSNYGSINLQNFRPIFTTQQLSESLRAMSLLVPALHASVLMDSEQLHADILAHLSSDPVAQKHIGITSDLRWMQSNDGFL